MRSLLFIVTYLIELYMFVIFAQVIWSWLVAFNVVNRRNQFVSLLSQVLYQLTEPAYRPIRNILPSTQPIDFSPFVLVLLLALVRSLLFEYWPV